MGSSTALCCDMERRLGKQVFGSPTADNTQTAQRSLHGKRQRKESRNCLKRIKKISRRSKVGRVQFVNCSRQTAQVTHGRDVKATVTSDMAQLRWTGSRHTVVSANVLASAKRGHNWLARDTGVLLDIVEAAPSTTVNFRAKRNENRCHAGTWTHLPPCPHLRHEAVCKMLHTLVDTGGQRG